MHRRFFVTGALSVAGCGGHRSPEPAMANDQYDFELRSAVFANTRTIRVLTPPSYDGRRRFPVVYFLDGRAAMDAPGLDAPGVARALWAAGEVPEFIIVGVDNGASTRESVNPLADRASEFLPYPDPNWTDMPAPQWRGDLYPDFLVDEVKAEIDARFQTLRDRETTIVAGSSYAGIAALNVALDRPDTVGAMLLQSPSAHVGAGRLLADIASAARLPATAYIDVGAAEGQNEAIRRAMVDDCTALAAALAERIPRLRFEVAEAGQHNFAAWRERLPQALRFVMSTRG